MTESFFISSSDPTPLHAQLKRAIQFAIATGKLNIGEQLPTVRQLAVELRINANTVAKAYADLERRGVVETRRGVGTFISERRWETKAGHREEHLRDLGDRVIAEAGAMGFSLDDLIEHLGRRRMKEKKHV